VPAFTYPETAELLAIEQDLMPRLEEGRLVFDFFPIEDSSSFYVRWEQRDNYLGLQQVRGLNGEPPKIKRVGFKTYQMPPGVYGEYVFIDEEELTVRRQQGTWDQPVDVGDLVGEAQEQLLQRELDRIEWIVWTLLTTGTFSVSAIDAAVVHTDAYTTLTFTASPAWATVATATPLKDFRTVQLNSRGRSSSYGAQARAYMNRVTFNNMISNSNTADLGGRRTAGLNTLSVLNLQEINTIFAGEDLPGIVIYDQGYLDDTGTFQPFIPNAKVVVIGARPNNQPVGAYMVTKNVNSNDGSGRYTRVIDGNDENDDPPRKLRVHRGHNGGPALFYPGAVTLMNV
jgi:hypothetical protein